MWWLDDPPASTGNQPTSVVPQLTPPQAATGTQNAASSTGPSQWCDGEARELRAQLLGLEQETRQRETRETEFHAQEAQLRATEDQLRATEAQLRATEDRLRATEAQRRERESDTERHRGQEREWHATELTAAAKAADERVERVTLLFAGEIERLNTDEEIAQQWIARLRSDKHSLMESITGIESELAELQHEAEREYLTHQSETGLLRQQVDLLVQIGATRAASHERLRSQREQEGRAHREEVDLLHRLFREREVAKDRQHAAEIDQLSQSSLESEQKASECERELLEATEQLAEQQRNHIGEVADVNRLHRIEVQRLTVALQIAEKKAAQAVRLDFVAQEAESAVHRLQREAESDAIVRFEQSTLIETLQDRLRRATLDHRQQCEELQKQTESRQLEIETDHLATIASLQIANRDLDKALSATMTNHHDMELAVTHLRDSHDRQSQRMAEVLREKEAAETRIAEYERLATQAEFDRQSESLHRDTLARAFEELAHRNDVLTQKNAERTDQRNAARQTVGEYQKTLVQARSEIAEAEKRRESMEVTIASQKQAIDAYSKKVANQAIDVRQTSEHAARLQQELTQSEAQAQSLSHDIACLHRERESLRENLAETIAAKIAAEALSAKHERQCANAHDRYRSGEETRAAAVGHALESEQVAKAELAALQDAYDHLTRNAHASITTLETRLQSIETIAEEKSLTWQNQRSVHERLQHEHLQLQQSHANEVRELTQLTEGTQRQCHDRDLRLTAATDEMARIQKVLSKQEERNRQLLAMQTGLRQQFQQRLAMERRLTCELQSTADRSTNELHHIKNERQILANQRNELLSENHRLQESYDALCRQQLILAQRMSSSAETGALQRQAFEAELSQHRDRVHQRDVEAATLRSEIIRIGQVAGKQSDDIQELESQVDSLARSLAMQLLHDENITHDNEQWKEACTDLELEMEMLRGRLRQEAAIRRKVQSALRRFATGNNSRADMRQTWAQIGKDELLQRLVRRLEAVEKMRCKDRRIADTQMEHYQIAIDELESRLDRRNAA